MFIAIDGDDVGRRLEYLIVKSTPHEVEEFSKYIGSAVESIVDRLLRIDGKIIVRGGDNILAEIRPLSSAEVKDLVNFPATGAGIQFSVGTGETLVSAFLALKLAKAGGKNRCFHWTTDHP